MSLQAMLWALEDAPVDDPQTLLVLIALAERAGPNGEAAYPAREWLAGRARCSVRTVQRRVASLEEDGLIRRGDQALVDHFRADRRPVVWDLDLTASRGDSVSPREATGCQAGSNGVPGQASRGDTVGTQTVHKPKDKPSSIGDFETWWPHYPRKAAKGQARTAFVKAMKKTDLDTLIAATKEFANIREKQISSGESKPEFTPYPSTWLNGERWEEFSPKQSQDVLVEFLAEHSFAELERATGIRCMTPEFGGLEFGERREAVRVFRERWLVENRDRLAEALR